VRHARKTNREINDTCMEVKMAAVTQPQPSAVPLYPNYPVYQPVRVEVVHVKAEDIKGGMRTGCLLGFFLSVFGLIYLLWVPDRHARITFIKGWVVGALLIPFVTAIIVGFILFVYALLDGLSAI